MQYSIETRIRDNPILRSSFNALAEETFGLSFEAWHQAGYWTERYLPYAACAGGRVIANASVNLMDTVWNGKTRRFIQIGTVMTARDARGMGIARSLLERILQDWERRSDLIYLFANDTVLDFYPRFGFERVQEYQFRVKQPRGAGAPLLRKLDMEKTEDRERLRNCYERGNPLSRLPMRNNFGLLMFYCSFFLKDCVYYSRDLDAVLVIGEEDGERHLIEFLGGRAGISLKDAAGAAGKAGTEDILLGFAPEDPEDCVIENLDTEDFLFVRSGRETIKSVDRIRFPELSHA